jgi:hypothetical protein
MEARISGRISAGWRRLETGPALRSKRSRVRVAPGPLWKILPRRCFGVAGFFVALPCPAAGNVPGNKPHVSEPVFQRLEVLVGSGTRRAAPTDEELALLRRIAAAEAPVMFQAEGRTVPAHLAFDHHVDVLRDLRKSWLDRTRGMGRGTRQPRARAPALLSCPSPLHKVRP